MLGGYYLYKKIADKDIQENLLQMAGKGDGKNQKKSNKENKSQSKNKDEKVEDKSSSEGQETTNERYKQNPIKNNKEAQEIAKELGYTEEVMLNVRGKGKLPGYRNKKGEIIVRDLDRHSGGSWKKAKSEKDFKNNTNIETWNRDLTELIKVKNKTRR